MKFKESMNWKKYPMVFRDEMAIDLIGSLLRTNKDNIDKIRINAFKDGNREIDYNCKWHEFEYYVDAYKFLENKELLEIDEIYIYWNDGVVADLYVYADKMGGVTLNFYSNK